MQADSSIALPSKPLNIIALSDADSESALSLVKQKLQEANLPDDIDRDEITYIERLGGRAEDLESVSVALLTSGSSHILSLRSLCIKSEVA